MSLAAALAELGCQCVLDAPLSRQGFWRLGGAADALVTVTDTAQLAGVMGLGVPVTPIGNGSNLLIADAGIRGITLALKGDFLRSAVQPDATVVVGAGLRNTVLLRRLDRAGLGGLGCLAGIPGTVGGAVCMNAGWRLGEISDRLLAAEVVLPGGAVARLEQAALRMSYRRCAGLPAGAVISRVWLSVEAGAGVAAERALVREHLARRKASQPLDRPSCGSVFRNPPGDHAGRLIEAAGLKGRRQGGAQISDRHANFIVNNGGATAADVYALITTIRREVCARFGVVLEPEVRAVGDWPEGSWPLPAPG